MRLLPLHRQLFVEPNPIPVKWAAARMGLVGTGLRLPLTPLSTDLQSALENALRSVELI
jgi:4-hydroxy-tetrahydrodipicolinate synthase